MWPWFDKIAVVFPIITFLLIQFVGAYVFAQHNRSRINRTFLIFTYNSAAWIGCELLFCFPLLNGWETEFWRFSSFFWIFIGFWYLEFANAIAGKKRGIVSYIGIATASLGYIFTISTDLVISGTQLYQWGIAPICNPTYHLIISANTALFTLIGMGVLYKKRRSTNNETLIKTIELMLYGTVVGATTIGIVNVIVPDVMNMVAFPRYGASAMGVFMILVFYAIMKYQFLSISPHEVAEEIYEDVSVGIILLDADGIVMRANRKALDLLGKMTLGTQATQMFWGQDAQGEFAGKEVDYNIKGQLRSFTLCSSKVIRNDQDLGTILMVQDVTDQKVAERVLRKSKDELEKEVAKRTRQLRQAQRMETIGTLAGGIAHDFNNSLAVILGFSKAALMDLPKENPVCQDIKEVILAASRGEDMVNQIMTLARKENSADFRLTNINTLVGDTITLLKVSTPKHITVRLLTSVSLPNVNCSPTQLHQVITNLYTNACQAMKNSEVGSITIELDNINIDDPIDNETQELQAGSYLRLRFKDTGEGIAPKNLLQIFDPFFTTKARDEGTGLGLSSTQVIIHNHEGEIFVESVAGQGTLFTIYLPQDKLVQRRSSVPPPPLADGVGAVWNERILWVDDKPQILRMGKRMLSLLGYRITTAQGGFEALSIFEKNPSRFKLVITDYSMPEISGTELAVKFRKIMPDIPIILVSGYGEAVSEEELKAGRITGFLKKPLDAKELGKTIRGILNR